jgi:serine protease Do
LKRIPFLKSAVGALVLCGGLAIAHAALQTHINLKLADPNEGPSHITMAPAAKRAMPSVVKISASKLVKAPAGFQGDDGDNQQLDPLFRQFFGRGFGGNGGGNFQAPKPHREGGLGSGVIVSPDGYILTNNHVVDGATDVTVTLADRREFKARVIGTDPKIDLALIKIDASGLPAITVGDSSKLQVGDAVLAIGNPYGVGQTVTMGIVSATDRTGLGIEDYEDFIQTDASINPGNSGGALVNDRGELVGINTAILSHGSGGNQGIGFAVPVNLARNVMDQLATHGHVTRSYLGVSVQEVTPAIAKAMDLNVIGGALVSDVTPDSPAARAGLQTGDVITAINGTPINDSNQLRMTVSMMTPDQNVKLKVLRNHQEREFTVSLGQMPEERQLRAGLNSNGDNGEESSSLQGISVANIDSDTAQQLHLKPGTKGVVVTEVDPSSQAAANGLQEGDVIQEVNRQPVTNVQDFRRAMRQGNKGDELLLVNRGGNRIFLAA